MNNPNKAELVLAKVASTNYLKKIAEPVDEDSIQDKIDGIRNNYSTSVFNNIKNYLNNPPVNFGVESVNEDAIQDTLQKARNNYGSEALSSLKQLPSKTLNKIEDTLIAPNGVWDESKDQPNILDKVKNYYKNTKAKEIWDQTKYTKKDFLGTEGVDNPEVSPNNLKKLLAERIKSDGNADLEKSHNLANLVNDPNADLESSHFIANFGKGIPETGNPDADLNPKLSINIDKLLGTLPDKSEDTWKTTKALENYENSLNTTSAEDYLNTENFSQTTDALKTTSETGSTSVSNMATSINPAIFGGAALGGAAGAYLGGKIGGKKHQALGSTLGGIAGMGLGGYIGSQIKNASILAPKLTEKLAYYQVAPAQRPLPIQEDKDPYYYPSVGSHALAVGTLGTVAGNPTVGLSAGLGTYMGGKLGRGIGTTMGYPNAGALIGEAIGGAGGAYLPTLLKQSSVYAPNLTTKIATDSAMVESGKNFIKNIPNNPLAMAGGGALIGREIGREFGHKNLGTAAGAGLGAMLSSEETRQGMLNMARGAGDWISGAGSQLVTATKNLFQ